MVNYNDMVKKLGPPPSYDLGDKVRNKWIEDAVKLFKELLENSSDPEIVNGELIHQLTTPLGRVDYKTQLQAAKEISRNIEQHIEAALTGDGFEDHVLDAINPLLMKASPDYISSCVKYFLYENCARTDKLRFALGILYGDQRELIESRKSKPQVAITDNTVESEITLLEKDPVTNELLNQVAAFLLETLAHPDEIHSWKFLDDKVFFALANAELGGYLKPQQVEELNRLCSESPLWSHNRTTEGIKARYGNYGFTRFITPEFRLIDDTELGYGSTEITRP